MDNSELIIDIFTDGACSGNPGPGGYAALMRIRGTDKEKEVAEGYAKTTNNRMELLAVISALEKIKIIPKEVHIYTDSKYVADAVLKSWLHNWEARGWKNVKNPDLWKRFLPLMKKYNPQFHWIKGHAGHPENERCDILAVRASREPYLLPDIGYVEK